VAAEFAARALDDGAAVDAALAELRARGRRLARAEAAAAAWRRKVAALEMLTRVRFVDGEGRFTGAAWVLAASHVALPLLVVSVLRQDVEGVERVASFLSML
jgi:hypothetical protein